MLQKKAVKIVLTFTVAIFFIAVGFWFGQQTLASLTDNVSGWAWSETIGWISFNSTDCDADENGFSDGFCGEPSSAGLVSHWKLNEISGTDAIDSVGPNNGILINMDPATDWVSGKIDGALDFDGNFNGDDDVVSIPGNISLDVVNITMAAWVNSDLSSQSRAVLTKTPMGAAYRMRTMDSGGVEIRITVGGIEYIASGGSSVVDTWIHLAGTYDGETVRAYLDGQEVGINTGPSGPIDISTGNLCIGNQNNQGECTTTPEEHFDGTIDEVRLYDRALSGEEIEELYNVGEGLIPVAPYGVDVDLGTGNFSGYAWSSHIGWIKFNPQALPPVAPGSVQQAAQIDRTGAECGGTTILNEVCGWARACSVIDDSASGDCEGPPKPDSVTGGWDGWISLRGDAVPAGPTDAVAHWKFDETLGTNAVDSSVNGNDGTLISTPPPIWSPGQIGGALDFDGVDDSVEIPSSISLNPSSEVTVALWAKLDACSTVDGTFVAKSNGIMDSGVTSVRYALWYEGDGSCTSGDLVFCVNDADNVGANCVQAGNGINPENVWTHYTGTYNGSELRVYRDGVSVASKLLTTSITGGSGNTVTIGQAYSAGGQRINGILDDVRIYNRALTAQEIEDLYIVAGGGAVGHWKLDDATGSPTAADSSGNGNIGTLVNMDPAADWVAGQVDGALDFDGASGIVTIAETPALEPTGDMTVTAWVKLDVLPSVSGNKAAIVYKSHNSSPWFSYQFMFSTNNVDPTLTDVFLGWHNTSETYFESGYTGAGITAGTWNHIAAVRDGSSLRFYFNGSDADTYTDTPTGIMFDSDDGTNIGASWTGGGRTNGQIDDVRFYDRALTPQQILGIYEAVVPPPTIPYGVEWNSVTQELEGWAWGSEVVGWLSFNCLDLGACATPYKVIVDLNIPPIAENLFREDLDYCFSSSPPIVLLWDFVDPGDTQSAYQVQVDDNSDFGSLTVDSGKFLSAFNEYVPSGLSYGITYYWRVMVWDSKDKPSGWIYPLSPPGSPTAAPGDSFTTQEKHPDPSVFDWIPDPPAAEEEVQFNDNTTFSGVLGVPSWAWDFETDSIVDSTLEDPTHIYPDNANYSVTLTACADGIRCCSSTKALRTLIPFPEWREISPF